MKPHVRRLAWVLSGLSVLGVTSLLAVACSTTNGDDTGAGVNSPDAAKADAKVTPPVGEGGPPPPPPPPGDGGPPPDGGGPAPDCGTAPRLRGPDGGPGGSLSFFCPFQARDAGAPDSARAPSYCADDQACCAPSFPTTGGNPNPSYCTGESTACLPDPNGVIRWECAAKEHCGPTQKCCIPGTDAGPPTVDTEKVGGKLCPPAFQRGFYIGGTKCEDTGCAAGELEVCWRDADCSGGKKCVAFVTNTRDMGVCK